MRPSYRLVPVNVPVSAPTGRTARMAAKATRLVTGLARLTVPFALSAPLAVSMPSATAATIGAASAGAVSATRTLAGTTTTLGPAFRCASPTSFYTKSSASKVDVTVKLGDVTAAFSASPANLPAAGPSGFRHGVITVAAPGEPARRVPVSPPWGFSTIRGVVELTPITGGPNGSPFCVARFGRASPETAVVVGTFSGGAHCCTWLEALVALPRAAAGARPIWQDIGNPGVGLRSYAGATLLLTADNSFAYTFDSYAGSGMPIRILELKGHEFVATTRSYPLFVKADAKFWWQQYEQVSGPKGSEPRGGLGLLAPWVADECLLGDSSSAWATVARLQSQGRLAGGTPGWPRGAAYVRALRAFLVRQGYCPASTGQA